MRQGGFWDLELELRVPRSEGVHLAAVQALNIGKSWLKIFSLVYFAFQLGFLASKNFYEIFSFLISFKLNVAASRDLGNIHV